MRRVSGVWNIGTQDNEVVYIERCNSDGDPLFTAHMTSDEARLIGQGLIDKANLISPL